MLIVTSNGAIFNQWVGKVFDNYQDLHLIISNDDKPSDSNFLKNWVSSTAMSEAPHKLDNWPEHLRFVFDRNDARASKALIISPFDSHAARTMDIIFVEKSKLQAKKGTLITERQAKSKTKRRGRHLSEQPIFKTKWKG